jgi:hypothetical protein
MRLDEDKCAAGRWLDVKQVAEVLGISSDAVRKRISRGTLRSSKDEDGSVMVWLDTMDDRLDDDQPTGWTEARYRLDDLIAAKDEALRDLRDQLEHMRRESERKDAIIMQMAQANAALAARVPVAPLESSSDERDSRVTASEEQSNGAVPPFPGQKERAELRWWRRWFGF